ncbi:MAG: glycosyltransferase [Deltaproteobacteria bacterium]|nr:glycosyltransferase [Deltaproteobacteria bacterium]
MNILFLSTYYSYPPDTGHYIRTYNTVKYLAKKNNLFFLSFAKERDNTNNYTSLKDICKSVDMFFVPADFSKLLMAMALFKSLFSANPFSAIKYCRNDFKYKLEEILQNNKIDIVHFDSLYLACYLRCVGGVTTALTVHNVESQRMLSLLNSTNNVFKRMFIFSQYKRILNYEKKVCHQFDICVTVSDNDMQNLRRINSDGRFDVIPNGVDLNCFSPGKVKPEPNSMIWIGSMEGLWNRGAIDYFCNEIFPKIDQKINNVKFTVVGKSPTSILKNISVKNKNVMILGYVDDISNYVNRSSVFVVPLKAGGGTKLKVLNALAMGKAVVTTSVGAEGIEVTDNENIVIADDPETFAGKTVELLRNPEMVEELGRNAATLIRIKYDWEIIAKKHRQIYKEIVEGFALREFNKQSS